MRVAITGAEGFLGWHARCALRSRDDVESVVTIDRSEWANEDALAETIRRVDLVLHFAGANRAAPEDLREGNLALALALTAALDRSGDTPIVVYANSIHAGDGTPFGEGKQLAAEHLLRWGQTRGAAVLDARLPNLFGEHGRPHYNSVVATFCHQLATGGAPVVQHDRDLSLLHVQDAVDEILTRALNAEAGTVTLVGRRMTVRAILAKLESFRDLYATGDIPAVVDPFDLALFNTYRSFTFPSQFPIHPELRSDNRGGLFECVRAHGGQAQVFCSSTYPGVTRGEHFHRRKIERFMVLAGEAEISLRRLFHDRIVRFPVSGGRPAIVDMPTMWAHSITNTGSSPLMTLFWAHEILDPARPDTFPEAVGAHAAGVSHG